MRIKQWFGPINTFYSYVKDRLEVISYLFSENSFGKPYQQVNSGALQKNKLTRYPEIVACL